MRASAAALLVALVACGGGPPPTIGAREAQTALRLARADFARHRYAEAASSYDRALAAAERLDDAPLLATAGTERALALLRSGDSEAAAREAAALDAMLERRGAAAPAMLPLVRAAAALDAGREDEALAELARVEATGDPLVAGRVAYLRGRAAAARGDRAGLAAAIAAMASAAEPTLAADRLELEARLARLDDRPAVALARLDDVLAARRSLDQPLLVGETLELAGEAAAAAGQAERAADLFLRAARNAAASGRPDLVGRRLARAEAIAGHASWVGEAAARLREGREVDARTVSPRRSA